MLLSGSQNALLANNFTCLSLFFQHYTNDISSDYISNNGAFENHKCWQIISNLSSTIRVTYKGGKSCSVTKNKLKTK